MRPTTAVESSPPERNAPKGTSDSSRRLTAFSRSTRTWATATSARMGSGRTWPPSSAFPSSDRPHREWRRWRGGTSARLCTPFGTRAHTRMRGRAVSPLHPPRLRTGVSQKRFHLRPEDERVPPTETNRGFFPARSRGHDQASRLLIPDPECEHALEPLDDIDAPLFVSVSQHLSVALSAEAVAGAFHSVRSARWL